MPNLLKEGIKVIGWELAGGFERKVYTATSLLFSDNPGLLDFLFDRQKPELRASPEELLAAARGLSSGDFLRVRVALDLWSGSGSVSVHELLDADPDIYRLVLRAMASLAA